MSLLSKLLKEVTGETPIVLLSPDPYEEKHFCKVVNFSKNAEVDTITNLLKKNDSGISAVKANKLLISAGLLEE